MDAVWRIAGTAAILAAVPVLCRARAALRPTTLTTAWNWAAVGFGGWMLTWCVTVAVPLVRRGTGDQLWYAVAVGMLCPPIAVLGAKRPGSRVWTWFVLLPLLLVLGWPALTVWTSDLQPEPLQIEVPVLIGYGLVLVMGTGNYYMTRFTLPALLYATAMLLVVAPFSTAVPDHFPAADLSRTWATLCLAGALATAALSARRRATPVADFDRLWSDFRNWFGIVWAKRIQDRLNRLADKERWPARLELDGIVWRQPSEADDAARAETRTRIEHHFRWLLRRFVDAEWIDSRLPASAASDDSSDPK